jgi:uncharacterized RDD family membrane protein YckC
MSTIRIQTTQHTELEYTLAGVGDRLIAYLIDLLLYMTYGIGLAVVMMNTSLLNFWNGAWVIVLILPILFYQLLCEIFMNGQSIGKRIRSIRVISLDGNQPSIGQYLIRWLFRIVDDMIGTGVVAIVSISLSEKAQRLGDMLAGTTVVRTKTSTVFDDTLFMEADGAHEPVFPQVIRLKDRDVNMLKEVIRRVRSDPERHQSLLEKACARTLDVLGVDTDLASLDFLEAVIRDYNHITSMDNSRKA